MGSKVKSELPSSQRITFEEVLNVLNEVSLTGKQKQVEDILKVFV